jgi:hypothetical protein
VFEVIGLLVVVITIVGVALVIVDNWTTLVMYGRAVRIHIIIADVGPLDDRIAPANKLVGFSDPSEGKLHDTPGPGRVAIYAPHGNTVAEETRARRRAFRAGTKYETK